MKIIDLLNKIARDELEDGFKFNYRGIMYIYKKGHDGIWGVEETNVEFLDIIYIDKLNDEIEIIEEQEYEEMNPIKKLDYDGLWNRINELTNSVNKINKYIADKEN